MVNAALPDRLFVPKSLPPSFAVHRVEDGLFEGKPAASRVSTVTLYGDPRAVDPLTKPLLVAIWNEGSDSRLGPPGSSEGLRDTKVRGHRGEAGSRGGDQWVSWRPPDDDQEADSSSILGRGVSQSQARDAAEHSRISREAALIETAGLPEGMQALVTGHVQLDDPVPTPSVRVGYQAPDGASLLITTTKGGDDLAHLVRLSVRGEQRAVRGHPGSVGTATFAGSDNESIRYAWAEDGHVIVVSAVRVPTATVEAFVDGLEPVDAVSALPRLKRALSDYPPERLIAAGETLAVSGRMAGGVWAVGIAGHGENMTQSHYAVRAGGAGGGGSGSHREGVFGTSRVEFGHGYLWVVGSAPPGSARVAVEIPGRPPITADVGRVSGYREVWFGAWIDVEHATTPTVVAYDGAGKEIWRSDPQP